jgi:hypothetical protein
MGNRTQESEATLTALAEVSEIIIQFLLTPMRTKGLRIVSVGVLRTLCLASLTQRVQVKLTARGLKPPFLHFPWAFLRIHTLGLRARHTVFHLLEVSAPAAVPVRTLWCRSSLCPADCANRTDVRNDVLHTSEPTADETRWIKGHF